MANAETFDWDSPLRRPHLCSSPIAFLPILNGSLIHPVSSRNSLGDLVKDLDFPELMSSRDYVTLWNCASDFDALDTLRIFNCTT